MNPGSPNPHNLELKATKAIAPQALSFHGFFCFPGPGSSPGEAFFIRHGADYGGLKASGMLLIISFSVGI
jgi:hypothetical protein